MKKSIFVAATLGFVLAGCHNSNIEFDDFDYQTIYFSTQTPVRSITLGDDGDFNNDMDNAHAFEIKACLGGVNVNGKERTADFVVDNSLCDGITFSDGRPVLAMPANYYTLSSSKMVIPVGNVIGGVKVQLTDAYFADPLSTEVNYVVPLVLIGSNDSILCGKVKDGVENPSRLNRDHWSTLPKDYVLYAVKYKNPYHGCWLSKGSDVVENNGTTTTNDRNVALWEKAGLRYLTSASLTRAVYAFKHIIPVVDADGKTGEKTLTIKLNLDIAANGDVTVSTDSEGCTATGSGKWTRKGEPKAWGDKDRDLLKLNYTYAIDYVYNAATGQKATYKVTTDESLVMRDRQNKSEEFSYTLK